MRPAQPPSARGVFHAAVPRPVLKYVTWQTGFNRVAELEQAGRLQAEQRGARQWRNRATGSERLGQTSGSSGLPFWQGQNSGCGMTPPCAAETSSRKGSWQEKAKLRLRGSGCEAQAPKLRLRNSGRKGQRAGEQQLQHRPRHEEQRRDAPQDQPAARVGR